MKALKLCPAAILILLSVFIATTGQAPADPEKEFRSIAGRFGIRLPQAYTSYTPVVTLDLADQKFFVSIYRWNLPFGQFSVSHASNVVVERPGQTNVFFERFRARVLGQSEKLLRERQTALDGHNGLELISESGNVQTVTQIFVVKYRIYILTMSLSPAQRADLKPALTAFNSFRLLPPAVVEDELRKAVANFAPEALPQEPFVARPTTDAQDEGLKGKVKTVTVELEDKGNNVGVPQIPYSETEFNERGYLTRYVEYGGDVPATVIIYGYLNGERAARMAIRPFEFVLITDKPLTGPSKPASERRMLETLKFIYKYNNTGQLLERRILFTNGNEFERNVYDLKKKKMEHSGGNRMFGRLADRKVVYVLDATGNPVEKHSTHETRQPYSEVIAGGVVRTEKVTTSTVKDFYTYEFDSQGNWIKQVTTRMEDGKSVLPTLEVIYRKISYF